MLKAERIRDIEQCSINQIYTYIRNGNAMSVKCIRLEAPNKVTVATLEGSYQNNYTIDLDSKYESSKLYMHNALLIKKYNKLKEQHEQELEDLFLGKTVIIYNLSELEKKDKWYRKLCKKLKKKFKI